MLDFRALIREKIDWGLVIVGLLALLIIQNFLQPGAPSVADFQVHLYRTLEYKNAWAPGVIVPRWGPNLAFGYGYPLFVFTPPLPHFLILGFHVLGLTLAASLKAAFVLTILLYAGGMFLLARDTLSSAAGLVAGTAYAFAPFALREALLYGGNLPQFLAIALFPWTLWAMTRAASGPSWGWVIVAGMFYAGIMLSHLFQVVVFTPVAGAYGLLLIWLVWRGSGAGNRSVGKAVAGLRSGGFFGVLGLLAIPLGLLLSAFFWLPAFTERFYTRAQADIYLQKSPFYIRYPYLDELLAWIAPLDARAANPYVPLSLGVVALLLAGVGLGAGVWLLFRRAKSAPTSSPWFIFFFALLGAAAVFLILPVSRPLWDRVTILQLAQFPWRLLGVANLALAFLAGAALLWFPQKWRMLPAAVCVVIQIFAVAPLLYPVVPFTPYGQITLADQLDYERRSQAVGATTLSEYLPKTVAQPPTTSPLVPKFLAGETPERLDRNQLPERVSAKLLKQTAVTHIYQVNSPAPFTARLLQYNYPGWQARLDSEPVPIRTEPDTGFILVDIPAGRHTLTAHFGETPGRVAALAVSGLTVVGLVMAAVYLRRSRATAQQSKRNEPVSSIKIGSIALLILMILTLLAAAFWLKPLLRPVFTVDSPPEVVLPAQTQTDIRFDHGIRLVGYDLPQTVVAPGERLPVVLYWETDRAPIPANLQPFVHLDRPGTWETVADSTNYTPGDVTTEAVLPTFHWDTTRYVRDEHDLRVPKGVAPQAYALRVGLFDPDLRQVVPLLGGGDTAQLAWVNVSPVQSPPPLQQPLDVTFTGNGDALQLTGFQIDGLTPEQLEFTLAWRADRRPQKNYIVFAQLLDSGQNLAAGFDRPPLDGVYPTSTWLPGQTIIDPRVIPLDGVSPGEYRLVVGLYDPGTQQRLTIESGANFFELTTIVIQR